jgi:hypothetical protein
MDTTTTETLKYQPTYWFNEAEQIAAVRISDLTVQMWQAKGNEFTKDFKHSHIQSTYPTKERLDEALSKFQPSTLDKYLEVQFRQHHLDDYFRQKANEIKEQRFKNLNPPPPPPDRQWINGKPLHSPPQQSKQ